MGWENVSKSVSLAGVILFYLLGAEFCTAQVIIDPARPDVTIVAGPQIDSNGNVRLEAILAKPHLLQDLELSDDQRVTIGSLIRKTGNSNFLANARILKSARSGDHAAGIKLQAELLQNRELFEAKAKETLLPHQIKAVGLIAFNQLVAKSGMDIFSSPIGKALDLSKEEKDRLASKAKEIEAELKKKIEKLRVEAINELLEELPAKKRLILKKRFGR